MHEPRPLCPYCKKAMTIKIADTWSCSCIEEPSKEQIEVVKAILEEPWPEGKLKAFQMPENKKNFICLTIRRAGQELGIPMCHKYDSNTETLYWAPKAVFDEYFYSKGKA